MSREIKFRVWDKLRQSFIFPDKNYQGHFILNLNGEFYNLQNGSGGDEYTVQQFTGLKDKNGRDIYEGDIINFTLKGFTHEVYPEDIKNAEVWYNEKDGMFCFGKYKTNDLIDYYFSMADRIDKKTMEIIGNVFENPELLKNKESKNKECCGQNCGCH